MESQPDGNIITNPQRFYGVVDKKGNILIPPDYDLIVQYEDRALFRVERGLYPGGKRESGMDMGAAKVTKA